MKQDLKKEMFELEQELDIQSHLRWHNSKPKQETLEEAANKWVFETNSHKWSNNNDTAGDNYGSFIQGVKWQQDRSYSEEEVRTLINRVTEFFSHHDPDEWKEWIEKQFKKK